MYKVQSILSPTPKAIEQKITLNEVISLVKPIDQKTKNTIKQQKICLIKFAVQAVH